MYVTNLYRAVNQNFIKFISSFKTETINLIREMDKTCNKNFHTIINKSR